MMLPINGRSYPVILDTGIEELDNTNANLDVDEFASNIYMVPLTMNGMPVLYWEYKDYGVFAPQTAALNGTETWWTDGGRFLWSKDGKYTCFDLMAETEPRIVLRTPHLAMKLEDVKYRRTYAKLRDPDPDSDYWKDGGVSIRNLSPTKYAVWN